MMTEKPMPIPYAPFARSRLMPAWQTVIASIAVPGSASALLRGWRWVLWMLALHGVVVGAFFFIGMFLVPALREHEGLLFVLFLTIWAGVIAVSIHIALAQRRALLAASGTQAAPIWLSAIITRLFTVVLGAVALITTIIVLERKWATSASPTSSSTQNDATRPMRNFAINAAGVLKAPPHVQPRQRGKVLTVSPPLR